MADTSSEDMEGLRATMESRWPEYAWVVSGDRVECEVGSVIELESGLYEATFIDSTGARTTATRTGPRPAFSAARIEAMSDDV